MDTQVIILLSPIIVAIPLLIMLFVAHYRDKKAEKEEANQNQAMAR